MTGLLVRQLEGQITQHISFLCTHTHPQNKHGLYLSHNEQCYPESHTLIPLATKAFTVLVMQLTINHILSYF